MQITDQKRQFRRTLLAMVLPIAFQSFMAAAVSASDAVMLGFLEQDAMSAVSLAGQVTFVLNICITVLVQGTTMLAAQYWGKGDRRTVEVVLAIALRYMLLVGMVFFAASMFAPAWLMRLLTDEASLVERGAAYLRIAGWSYIPMGISQIYLCIMKNSGKTGKSTLIGSSAMVLNLGLNAVLIFGLFGFPAMGIQGAALATSLSMLLQLIWTLADACKKDSLKIRLSYLRRADQRIYRDFNHYTLPIVGNYFFWGGGVTLFAIIIGHLGSDAVAANSIASIVRNLAACVSKGVGTAGAILVGNELGKNEIDIAKLFAKWSTILAAVIGACSGVVLLLIRPFVLSAVHLTPAATGYLSGMLLICSYYMIPCAINSLVIGGIFCAGGKSQFGCICDGIVLWLFITPLAFLAAFVWNWPVLAVYFIICLDEVVKVPVVLWYYRRYTWAQNLTRN